MYRYLSFRSRRVISTCLVLGGLLPVALAGDKQVAPPPLRATISPSVVRLQPGEQQRFQVTTVLARLEARTVLTDVRWSVNEVVGGNSEFGTIDPNGMYRAPAKVPAPREIRVRGEVEGVGNRYVWATVLMGAPGPLYEFVRFIGESTDQPQRLVRPHSVVIDNEGNILVIDENSHRVVRYSPEGEFLNLIGYSGPGKEPGQFTKPRDAAVDADGLIYVSDEKSDRPRIQVFSRGGEFIRIFGEKGTGPGMLLRAHGMQFDQHQRLFVVDVDNARVNVYDRSGELLFDWGKDGLYPGEFNAAHGLYLDPSGDVFISSYYGPVQKFTAEGKFLTAFGHGDPPDGPVHFHAIGGDRWGNVYVTVRNLGPRPNEVSIVKYNNNGDFITSWRLSTEDREVNWVRTDPKGFVYAAFRGRTHMGVEVFQPR